jgi:hypothetical protein
VHEENRSDEQLLEGMDAADAEVSDAQRRLLAFIARADRCEVWQDCGAQDMAHWLGMRYGLSYWKAARWISAAHAWRICS